MNSSSPAARAWISLALTSTLAMAQATWTDRTNASTPMLGMNFASAFDAVHGRLVIFGGRVETSSSAGPVDTQWEWDGSTWSSSTPAVRPGPRYQHDMAFDAARGVVVLSGGYNGNSRLPDTWEYDGSTWVRRNIAGPNEELFNHRMVFDAARGEIVRFGGSGAGGLKGDTHTWNGTSWLLRTTGGPPPREQHAMAYDRERQRVVLFGGVGASGLLQDTWTWDGSSWQQLHPSHVPPARAEAGLSPTGSSRQLVLFGGYAFAPLNDTWIWDGVDWTRIVPVGTPPPMAYFSLDLDTARDRVVLVRGQEFSNTHIAHWELHVPVASPASFTPFGSGCQSSAGVPQLDAASGSLPYIGESFTMQLTGIPASIYSPAFLLTGYSRTAWNGNPLPFDLGPLGLPGCSAWISPDAVDLLVKVGGTATRTWSIPVVPTLVGAEIHTQGAVMDLWQNAAGFVLANAGTVYIGRL